MKIGVAIVHGVGEPAPGEALRAFTNALHAFESSGVEVDASVGERELAEEAEDQPGGVGHFSMHFRRGRRQDQNDPEYAFAECFWGSVSTLPTGVVGVVQGFLQLVVGMRTVVDEVRPPQTVNALELAFHRLARGTTWILGGLLSSLVLIQVPAVVLVAVGRQFGWLEYDAVGLLLRVLTGVAVAWLLWVLGRRPRLRILRWSGIVAAALGLIGTVARWASTGETPGWGDLGLVDSDWILIGLIVAGASLLLLLGAHGAGAIRGHAGRSALRTALLACTVQWTLWMTVVPSLVSLLVTSLYGPPTETATLLHGPPLATALHAAPAAREDALIRGLAMTGAGAGGARTGREVVHRTWQRLSGPIGTQWVVAAILGLAIAATFIDRWRRARASQPKPLPRLIVSTPIHWALLLTSAGGALLVLGQGLHALGILDFGPDQAIRDFGSRVDTTVISALVVLIPLLFAQLRSGLDLFNDVITYLHGREAIRARLAAVIKYLVDDCRVDELVVVAHSQGTVVALDELAGRGSSPRRRLPPVRLVTMGSPISHLYQEYFSVSYGGWDEEGAGWDSLFAGREEGEDGVLTSWLNLYRDDDFVGTRVREPARMDPRPEGGRDGFGQEALGNGGHLGYWRDRRVLQALAEAGPLG